MFSFQLLKHVPNSKIFFKQSHCGDKTILPPSYLHNGISYIEGTDCMPPPVNQYLHATLLFIPLIIQHAWIAIITVNTDQYLNYSSHFLTSITPEHGAGSHLCVHNGSYSCNVVSMISTNPKSARIVHWLFYPVHSTQIYCLTHCIDTNYTNSILVNETNVTCKTMFLWQACFLHHNLCFINQISQILSYHSLQISQ